MTPQQAKEWFGATHYLPMKDGVTPQMYYKQESDKYSEEPRVSWVYLSFANIWMGSQLNAEPEHVCKLIAIEDC